MNDTTEKDYFGFGIDSIHFYKEGFATIVTPGCGCCSEEKEYSLTDPKKVKEALAEIETAKDGLTRAETFLRTYL